MRPADGFDFWETTAGKTLVGGFAVALVIFALLGGMALMASMVGPSWAEICAEKGGEVIIDELDENIANEWDNTNPHEESTERCVLP